MIAVLESLQKALLFLRACQGQGFGLSERQGAVREGGLHRVREVNQSKTPFDGRDAQARLRRHVRQGLAVLYQPGNGFRFFERRQVLPLHVLHRGKAAGVLLRKAIADFHGNREVILQVAAFLQQLEGTVAPFAG